MAHEKRKPTIAQRLGKRRATRRMLASGVRTGAPQPMGGILDTIIGDVSTGAAVVSDPYFGEVMCRVGQLKAVRANQSPPPCPSTPLGLPGGVGLGKLILPLRGFVLAEQYPILYPIAAFALIGLPFLIGYQWGRTEG